MIMYKILCEYKTKPKKIYKKSNIKIKKRVSDLEILCK